ncbi:MAG: hypothetical protein AAFY88_14965 [Acidobacteriota bacterium]
MSSSDSTESTGDARRIDGWQARIDAMWREVETEISAVNAFGQLPLRYRSVDYGTSIERLSRRLPSFTVRSSAGDGWVQPLRTLKLDDGSNWVMALLESLRVRSGWTQPSPALERTVKLGSRRLRRSMLVP